MELAIIGFENDGNRAPFLGSITPRRETTTEQIDPMHDIAGKGRAGEIVGWNSGTAFDVIPSDVAIRQR
jgi:hypothetical protein